jgi:hypothetical protein
MMQLPKGQILIDKYLCALCPETGPCTFQALNVDCHFASAAILFSRSQLNALS